MLRPLITGPVLAWSAVLLALYGPRTVCHLACLVVSLSLSRPPSCLSGPVYAWSAETRSWLPDCHYMIRSWRVRPAYRRGLRPAYRLVLSLYRPRSCLTCPIPAPSARLLTLPCPCTVRPISRLVLSLHGPPEISSGPTPARYALLLAWFCLCLVCALACLALSLSGPPSRLSLSCPCTVRPISRLVLSLYLPRSCLAWCLPARLVSTARAPACLDLFVHVRRSCLPCPVPVLSALLLALPCPLMICALACFALPLHGPRSCSSRPCTVHLASRLVLSLHGPPDCLSGHVPVPSALLLALSCPYLARALAHQILFLLGRSLNRLISSLPGPLSISSCSVPTCFAL